MTDIQAGPRVFYGWILVGVLLLILSVGVGTSMYMYSVLAGALEQEFGAGRLLLMVGSTGLMLVLGLCSPVIGTLLDRYSSKSVVIAGALVMGIGFILIALSVRAWMAMASYILFIAVGAATLSYLTAATLISRWFIKHRGLAIGIVSLGTQLGGFVYPPIFAAVMEAYNWRIAIGGLGLLIMAIIPVISWLTVVDRPEDIHQNPDGVVEAEPQNVFGKDAITNRSPTLPFLRLLGQRNFLLLIVIIGAAGATNSILLANLALFAMDLGEPAVRGAFLVSLVALLGIVFSPLIGWLCDIINIKVMTAILLMLYAASCLLFSAATTYPMLAIATCFMGAGGGGLYPLWASMVGHLYHSRIFGRVMGMTTMLVSMFIALMLLLTGWVHDSTGSYRVVFLSLLLLLALMTVLIGFIRVPGRMEKKFDAVDVDLDGVSHY